MASHSSLFRRAGAGAPLPAFAVPDWVPHYDLASLSAPDMILLGSGVLLIVALAVKLFQHQHHAPTAATPQGRDMRWWKNPPE